MADCDPVAYTSYAFKLRSGGPFPAYYSNRFFTHTFMVEKRRIDNYEATVTLKVSDDMSLQGGDHESASYNALEYMDNGMIAFAGQETWKPEYIEEEDMGVI